MTHTGNVLRLVRDYTRSRGSATLWLFVSGADVLSVAAAIVIHTYMQKRNTLAGARVLHVERGRPLWIPQYNEGTPSKSKSRLLVVLKYTHAYRRRFCITAAWASLLYRTSSSKLSVRRSDQPTEYPTYISTIYRMLWRTGDSHHPYTVSPTCLALLVSFLLLRSHISRPAA